MRNFKIIGLLIAAILIVTGCSGNDNLESTYITQEQITNFDVSYLEPTFVINVENEEVVAGFADNVFMGTINKFVEYNQRDLVTASDGSKTALTYTVYEVKVLEVMKGDLIPNEVYRVYVPGGLAPDGKNFIIDENAIIPDIGATYIFNTAINKSGNLDQMNGVQLDIVKNPKKSAGKIDPEVIEAQEATENEIPFTRDRYALDEEESIVN